MGFVPKSASLAKSFSALLLVADPRCRDACAAILAAIRLPELFLNNVFFCLKLFSLVYPQQRRAIVKCITRISTNIIQLTTGSCDSWPFNAHFI